MSKPRLDFRKYRSTELVESLASLIDVRGIYVASLLNVLVIAALTTIVVAAVFWTRSSGALTAMILLAGVLAGTVTGGLYAILQVIRQSLGNMMIIVDQMPELTKTVAHDMQSVNRGDTEMPSPRELVRSVYSDVFLPAIETAFQQKAGLAARPLRFAWQNTFGRLVRLAIRMLPAELLTRTVEGKKMEESATAITASLQKLTDNETRITAALSGVQKRIRSISQRLRFVLMLPGYAIFGAALIVFFLGFATLYLLLGQLPETNPQELVLRIVWIARPGSSV
jgi:hypothetical protein